MAYDPETQDLPTSGAISLNEIHIEAGGSSGTSCTINDSDIRGLIGKGSGVTMSFSEWYGASGSSNVDLSGIPSVVTGSNGSRVELEILDDGTWEIYVGTSSLTSGSWLIDTQAPGAGTIYEISLQGTNKQGNGTLDEGWDVSTSIVYHSLAGGAYSVDGYWRNLSDNTVLTRDCIIRVRKIGSTNVEDTRTMTLDLEWT